MTAPNAADLARAVEALRVELTCTARDPIISRDNASAILAALRSRDEAVAQARRDENEACEKIVADDIEPIPFTGGELDELRAHIGNSVRELLRERAAAIRARRARTEGGDDAAASE